jgi:hypothetical protein
MAADPSLPCLNAAIDQYRATPLGMRIGAATPSVEALADKSKATDAEKLAISEHSAARQKCVLLGMSYRRENLPPEVVFAEEDAEAALTVLMAKLYAGDITFGEYNNARLENRAKLQARLVAVDRQIAQDNAQVEAANAARRQAANQALQQTLQNQQMILLQQQQMQTPPARGIVNTDCTRTGNRTNCTSY